ncbi:MAG: GntR family transcriptional regulator [Lachnospiraceae bacterium]|nr:GntR family transcriptional regulator [Lachnospiraceae bacterium]
MEEHDIKLQFDELLPLRDVVFNTLRQAILIGELKPGERLMEIHLAKKLGVSRTPIREAIRMLELEGLVTMVPRKGAEVARISADDMRDVLEVRRSLDSLAVLLACDRIKDSEKEDLKKAEKVFEDAIKTKDATAIAQADVKFHDIILVASRNKRLLQMVNNLAERVYRYRLEYVKDKRNHERLITEHRLIMENIFAGEKDEAKKAIEIHIDNQEKNIIKQLSEENKAGNEKK